MRTLWLRPRRAWVTLTGTGTGTGASVAFGLLVFVSLLASLAIPRESAGLSNAALQRVIASSQPGDRAVTATAAMINPITNMPIRAQAADMAAADASLRSRLAANGMPIGSDPPAWEGLTTDYIQITGAAQAAGYEQPQFQITYRTALARYSHIVAGHLPAGGSTGGSTGVMQVAVTTATAARFGLRVGSRLDAGPVPLVVTGIIQPVLPSSAFWSAYPAAARPVLTPAQSPGQPYWIGVLFIGSGSLLPLESALDPVMSAIWWYPAALGQLTAGQADALETGLGNLVSFGATVNDPGFGSPVTATITSQIPSILLPFTTGENAVTPVLELLYVSLAVTGAVVVLLGARLVAQRRAAEFTLMRARGAALHQLGWLVLRANVIIAAVAGAAAAALAIGLTPGDGDPVGWWLAGVTIAVALAGPVLISVVPQRVAAPATGPAGGRTGARRAGGRRPAARRIIIETALAAVSIGGLVVLRNQGPASGNSSVYPSAAPVLVAIPVAIVVLRCYPPLVRELARIAGRSRGVVAFVGLARATRTPPGTVLPAFALVLVLAMVAFPDMISTAVTDSQVAASWQQVGVDAVIQAPAGGEITPAVQRQISSVPGIASTATAVVEDGSTPAGSRLSVVFVDPAQYAAVADQAPGPRFPLAALSDDTGGSQAVVPAAATSTAAQTVGTTPASISVGTGTITIRLAGLISAVPGVTEDSAVVVPLQALGPNPPEPNLLLVDGPGLDTARLSAVVRGALPGGSVTLRATALAALTTSPVPQAAQTILTQGMATAAAFGVLVLLLSLLLTARTREMTLARLATMGLRRWQAQLLLAAETLPPVVAAAIGGIVCTWLLAPLVGPTLNLAAFSGTGSAIAVTPAAAPLIASAAGLVVAAVLVLAVQAVITYHRGSTRALRIAD
jgi:putative ABC transport system permease protein